jgi:Chaperone of endosialidase
MYKPIQLKNIIPSLLTSLSRSPLRRVLLLTALATTLAWFALSSTTRAADGGLRHENTAEGDGALSNLTSGEENAAMGFNALFSNTTGNNNTANGFQALSGNTTGFDNTANGAGALSFNTIGDRNTANGVEALFSNTTGFNNMANGTSALRSNTTGFNNTANGAFALINNTNGAGNTANGVGALASNTTGLDNMANGESALDSNTTGSDNTANGVLALSFNTTGDRNTAEGVLALAGNTTGSNNIALGFEAGISISKGSNNIDIGNLGVVGESNKIRIGTKGTQKATFIAGISGVTVAGGVGVVIDSNGQLGTATSSARFKDEIKPMDKASEAILELQPVTFRYKHELDPDGIPQFGLVAEQVEKVSPDLVARDEEGKPYTVRYEAVNAMLLNEFLKEHRKVEEQDRKVEEQEATIHQLVSTMTEQRKGMDVLTARLKEQESQIQKVNQRLEETRTAPLQLVENR